MHILTHKSLPHLIQDFGRIWCLFRPFDNVQFKIVHCRMTPSNGQGLVAELIVSQWMRLENILERLKGHVNFAAWNF
jgi:hypothetical protein